MGRRKKSELVQENTKNVGDTLQGSEVPIKESKLKEKKRKASESDMETIWPGIKRCLDCGFAFAITTGETEYINEKGEKVIEKFGNETKLHNSYHGRWNEVREMYGKENVLTYKALRENLEKMPELLAEIKEKDYISDVLEIPNVLSEYGRYIELIIEMLPKLQQLESVYSANLELKVAEVIARKIADAEIKRESEIKAYIENVAKEIKSEITSKFGAIKTPELEEALKDENIQAELEKRLLEDVHKEYIDNIRKTYDLQIKAMDKAQVLPMENVITETCNRIRNFVTEIEKSKVELDALYKEYSLEIVEDIVNKYLEILNYYGFILSDINTLMFKQALQEEPNIEKDGQVIIVGKTLSDLDYVINKTLVGFDFNDFGFDISSVSSKILELNQSIPYKRDRVKVILLEFFRTEFTRSIRLWDFGKAQPKFDDFCILLWNTPKFLKFIKPYMTEYQYLTYQRNNKANRKLVDYKFDEAPYYFGNVTESDICYNCRKESEVCADCDSLETVTKCYTCDNCKCKNCGVVDLSYVDDLIYMTEDDTDIDTDDTPITEEELLRNEKIMEGFSQIMGVTNVISESEEELTHPDIL